MIVNLPVIPPDLGLDYCFTNWQQVANDLVGGAVVQFDATGSFGLLVQSGTPGAAQRNTFAWLNTNTGHLLRYNASIGFWVLEHPVPASDQRVYLYTGTAGSVDTLDGGVAGTPSDAGGPFWSIAAEFTARFPVGVGTYPSGLAVAVNGTGGLETAAIAKANLPTDQIDVKTAIIGQAGVGTPEAVVGNTYGSDAVAGAGRAVDGTDSDLSARYYSRARTEPLGSGTAISLLPPYIGCYFIRRTSRIYYTS